MELRDLRYFCTAAETEHISKAAEKLGVSQPFLTKIITQLEEELGCELFDHVGRRVKLNRYGKLLLESANKILDEIDLIHSRFESIVDDPDQPLRFAVGSSAYCSDLPLRYMQEFPGSSVSREYMDRPDLIRALEEGRVDFAICSPPISPKESESIISKAVHTERACLVMPAGHPLAEKEYVELNDLNGLSLITTLKGSDTRNNIDLLCKANNVSPSIIYESIDNNLILSMVSEGLGCTVFAWNYTRLLAPSEHYVIREFSDSCGVIALCRNRHAPMTQAQQRFEEFVMDYFEALA